MRIHSVVIPTLHDGGVGVIPTDTIYGIVGSALNKRAVLRIYKLRKRNPKKPMIILVSDMRHVTSDKGGFGIRLSLGQRKLLKKLWPNAVSVIFPCRAKKFAYLHRGTKTLAFRFPKPKWLRDLLTKTGPLVAPSANWEGKPPAATVRAAKKYFADRVDLYVDTGRLRGKPSTLISITPAGGVNVLRRGAVRVP